MTYNKKQQSYRKGKGTSRIYSSSFGSLLKVLLPFVLLAGVGVFVVMNLGLESFLFTQNKMELNENIIEEIEEVIEIEKEIEIDEEVKSDEEVFTIVQEMPRFPGCEDLDISNDEKKKCAEKKMLEFIYQNIKIPEVAKGKYFGDLIVVSFIVDKEGYVLEPKILRGEVEAMNEEALNLVKSMPRWISGKQRGKPVNVQFNLPIRIRIDD